MKYADRIRLIMKNRNINQDKLAEYAGAAQSTINRVLNGEVVPNYKTMTKIAKGLGVPVEALTHPDDSIAEIIFELSRSDKEQIRTILDYVKAIRSYKHQPASEIK
jgi:transcriptional regulator with XRE-family HTH domain